jgi:hypothetical protein
MDFDKVRLKEGNRLRIGKDKYVVLYIGGEANPDPHKNPPVRLYLAIYLHDIFARS